MSRLDELDLQAPTAGLPHRIPDILTIDRVAVERSILVVSAIRVAAFADGKQLSDHDAYVVEVGRRQRERRELLVGLEKLLGPS